METDRMTTRCVSRVGSLASAVPTQSPVILLSLLFRSLRLLVRSCPSVPVTVTATVSASVHTLSLPLSAICGGLQGGVNVLGKIVVTSEDRGIASETR